MRFLRHLPRPIRQHIIRQIRELDRKIKTINDEKKTPGTIVLRDADQKKINRLKFWQNILIHCLGILSLEEFKQVTEVTQ